MNIPVEKHNFVPPQIVAALAAEIINKHVESASIPAALAKNYAEALADNSLVATQQKLEQATETYENVSSALSKKAGGGAIPASDLSKIEALQKKADDLSNEFLKQVKAKAEKFKIDPDELGSLVHEVSHKVSAMEKGSTPIPPTQISEKLKVSPSSQQNSKQ